MRREGSSALEGVLGEPLADELVGGSVRVKRIRQGVGCCIILA
jgi:hypothetical protein